MSGLAFPMLGGFQTVQVLLLEKLNDIDRIWGITSGDQPTF